MKGLILFSAENKEVIRNLSLDECTASTLNNTLCVAGFAGDYDEDKEAYSDDLLKGFALKAGASDWEIALGSSGYYDKSARALALSADSSLLAVISNESYENPNQLRLFRLDVDSDNFAPLDKGVEIQGSTLDWDYRHLYFSPEGDRLGVFFARDWWVRGEYLEDTPNLCVGVVETQYPFEMHYTRFPTGRKVLSSVVIGDSVLLALGSRIDFDKWSSDPSAHSPSGKDQLLRYSFSSGKLHRLAVEWDTDEMLNITGMTYDDHAQRLWVQHEVVTLRGGGKAELSYIDLPSLSQGTLLAQPIVGFLLLREDSHGIPFQMLCRLDGGRVKGRVTDVNGNPAARTVEAFSRVDGRLLGRTQSSASNGRYDLALPYRDPCDVVFRALPGEGLPDLIRYCEKPLKAKAPQPFTAWPENAVELAGVAVPARQPPEPPPPPPKPKKESSLPPATTSSRPPMPKQYPAVAAYGYWEYRLGGWDWVWTSYPPFSFFAIIRVE